MDRLHTLKPALRSQRRTRRIGRGTGSGRGTYSTRGLKGQKARSGGRKGNKTRGLRAMILSIPKSRGFTRERHLVLELNLGRLNALAVDGALITPAYLREKKVWTRNHDKAKILGTGSLERKNVSVKGILCSASAAKAIRAAGGTVSA